MFLKIRNRVEKEFISRDGKRVSPIPFCIGYLGFAKKPCPKKGYL